MAVDGTDTGGEPPGHLLAHLGRDVERVDLDDGHGSSMPGPAQPGTAAYCVAAMTTEIERRFLPDHLPSTLDLGPGTSIRQGYLAGEGSVSVRLRLSGGAATLTVKAGAGLVRTEVDAPLPAEDAEALWPHTVGRRVDKIRHRVALGGDGAPVAEVDCFLGALAGLVLVEVEFDDEQAAAAFRPPSWFGPEITGRPEWSNAALARHGRPSSP